MTVRIEHSSRFEKEYRQLLKKHRLLKNDLLKLETTLLKEPRYGKPLGYDAYKIRLRIESKGKGKSRGARVISLLENEVVAEVSIVNDALVVHLLTIYDKSETDNISDKELREIIKAHRTRSSEKSLLAAKFWFADSKLYVLLKDGR